MIFNTQDGMMGMVTFHLGIKWLRQTGKSTGVKERGWGGGGGGGLHSLTDYFGYRFNFLIILLLVLLEW